MEFRSGGTRIACGRARTGAQRSETRLPIMRWSLLRASRARVLAVRRVTKTRNSIWRSRRYASGPQMCHGSYRCALMTVIFLTLTSAEAEDSVRSILLICFGSGYPEAANRLVEMVLRILGQGSVPIRATEWSAEADEPEPQQVAIYELTPADLELEPNCTIPHALDDQWVSRSLLGEMAASRRPLHELGEARKALVRREYLRALVTRKI